MDNFDIERASWTLDTLLYGYKAANSFEKKELIPFPVTRWQALKAVPLDKLLQIGIDCHIKVNGCGPQSWMIDVIPDKVPWLLGVDFDPCGDAHDILSTIGGGRIEFIMANLYFHHQLREACRSHFPKSWACGIRYGAVTSRLYYEAVSEFGWKHFVKR